MTKEIFRFIEKYVKEIQDNNAGVFVGAGFSKGAGYVDWKNLVKELVEDLELDIDKETDLVSLSQYNYNKYQNRSMINSVIINEFSKEMELTENHEILARLPIFKYWTTNYDSLIEDALIEASRVVDVKSRNSQLSITKPHRDAVVYKMHGDKEDPNEAILIKDDYEKYYRKHSQFITALSGDLISRTFLFVGFSFRDPNIDYILSRIQVEYGSDNSRQHYAIMKNVKEDEYENLAEFEYEKRKQELFVLDLKRYRIHVLLVDEYAEVTNILKTIEQKINYNNIFISGSAEEYGEFNEKDAIRFISTLSKQLIKKNYNIISGFGLGVGSSVISGALEEIYMNKKMINENRLLLRPFPQGEKNKQYWRQYRVDMISRAGISIFIFGNKRKNGEIVNADGMMEEFEIAKEKGNLIVPVGSTGYVAEKIWNKVAADIESFYGTISEEKKQVFTNLNIERNTASLIDNIIKFIELMRDR